MTEPSWPYRSPAGQGYTKAECRWWHVQPTHAVLYRGRAGEHRWIMFFPHEQSARAFVATFTPFAVSIRMRTLGNVAHR